METLQLAAIGVGVLVMIVLLALFINLFRAMTRFALAVGAVLAFLALAVVGFSFVTWPTLPSPSLEIVHVDGDGRQVQAEPEELVPLAERGPSAAVAVRRFLVGVIVAGALSTVGAVVGRRLWKDYQKRARIQEALTQAQVYAIVSGERLPQGMPRRLPQGGGNVIVVGGQETPQVIPQQPWEVLR